MKKIKNLYEQVLFAEELAKSEALLYIEYGCYDKEKLFFNVVSNKVVALVVVEDEHHPTVQWFENHYIPINDGECYNSVLFPAE